MNLYLNSMFLKNLPKVSLKSQAVLGKKFILGLTLGVIVFSLLFGLAVLAKNLEFAPNVTIPGSNFRANVTSIVDGTFLARYIKAWYKFGVGLAGILAVLMIAYGGIVWLFSGGDSGKIGQAKEIIVGAVIGLFLALGSYLILNTVNPELVNLTLKVPGIEPQVLQRTWCKDVILTGENQSTIFLLDECPPGQTCVAAADKNSTICGVKYVIPDGNGSTCFGASSCSNSEICAQQWWAISETPFCVKPIDYCFGVFDQVVGLYGLPQSQGACDYAMSMFATEPHGSCDWVKISKIDEIIWDILKITELSRDNPFYELFAGGNYRGEDSGCYYTP